MKLRHSLLPLILLLGACSTERSPAADEKKSAPDADKTEQLKPMSDQQLADFLQNEYLPYAQATIGQMDNLPDNEKVPVDIALQDLIKQTKALIKNTRASIASGEDQDPVKLRRHLMTQNRALIRLKQTSNRGIFQGYIYLGEKDVLPVQSLKSWHKMQHSLNLKLGSNYTQLIKLATEAPAGEGAPSSP
ncbi:MAG: hypothetical protein AAGK14_13475 [Verrucomicrobiota bacterium]